MDLVKAPLRISYVGGGTDYPEFYRHHEGAGVIAAAIDQYVYLYAHPLSEVAEENIRFTYRETESVSEIEDLRHPVMREMLRHANWNLRTNFGTFADLPSGVGLGGSSSFAVALATLILKSKGTSLDPHVVARLAVRVEREILKEPGGIQDQYVTSFGKIREYRFTEEKVIVSDSILDAPQTLYLENCQILLWLGESRNSNLFATKTKDSIQNNNQYLIETRDLFQFTSQELRRSKSPESKFIILRESVRIGWELKKNFTLEPNPKIKSIETVLANYKDIAMKLCGAGGSGFLLLLGERELLSELMLELKSYRFIFPKISSGVERVSQI